MTSPTADSVRMFILERFEQELSAEGMSPRETPDDFDLLAEGVIDSFGIVDLISAVENRYEVTLDFEGLEPDSVTVIGPLATYVANVIEQQRRQ